MVETNTQYTGKHHMRGRLLGGWETLHPRQISVAGIQYKLYLEWLDGINSGGSQQTAGGAR